jgi:hypothetical protein
MSFPFCSNGHLLENSFCKHERRTVSRYSRLLAEYFNRRLGLYSIPEFVDWSNEKLLYELEEAEKEKNDPFLSIWMGTKKP